MLEYIYLGYDRPRPPPHYYDVDYEDRYGGYDREYEGPIGRRPLGGGSGYPHYESPFNRPYGHGVGSPPPLDDNRPLPPPLHPYGAAGSIGPVTSGGGPPRPPVTRCEETDNFKQIAARHKMRRHYVRRSLVVPSLIQCERECIESRDFICRSFNYRYRMSFHLITLRAFNNKINFSSTGMRRLQTTMNAICPIVS